MARQGGKIPGGGDMRGCNNLAEITDSEEARDNLQIGGTHGVPITGSVSGSEYVLYVDDTDTANPIVKLRDA